MNNIAAITLEEMSLFCSTTKVGMKKPWRRGKFSFASDGCMVLRTPALAGSYTGIKAPNEGRINYVLSFFPKDGAAWEPLPELPMVEDRLAIGGGCFSVERLVKIKGLPGVKVTTAPMVIARREGKMTVTALAFTFDGDGIGLLLPMIDQPEGVK